MQFIAIRINSYDFETHSNRIEVYDRLLGIPILELPQAFEVSVHAIKPERFLFKKKLRTKMT